MKIAQKFRSKQLEYIVIVIITFFIAGVHSSVSIRSLLKRLILLKIFILNKRDQTLEIENYCKQFFILEVIDVSTVISFSLVFFLMIYQLYSNGSTQIAKSRKQRKMLELMNKLREQIEEKERRSVNLQIQMVIRYSHN